MALQQLAAYGTLLAAFAFALAVTAMIAAWRMARFGELIPYEPGPRAKSGLLEFALVFCAFVMGGSAGAFAGVWLSPDSSGGEAQATVVDLPETLPDQATAEENDVEASALTRLNPARLVGSAAGGLVGVLAVYLFWRVVLDRGPRTLAPSSWASTLGADVALGFWAFLMTAAPVYGLQGLLLEFFPQKHQLLLRLEEGGDLWLLLAAAFSAAIAAPVIEEIVFRGFLQSAFERLKGESDGWLTRLLFGASIERNSEVDGETETDCEAPLNYESPVEFRRRGGTLEEGFRRTLAGIASAPVLGSAVVFALMHLGQGPAPIPLFLFALMLGYLYRQTGRLTAPIVAHFALNATTLLLAGLSMLNEASGSDAFPPSAAVRPKIEATSGIGESPTTDRIPSDSASRTGRVR